MTNVAGKSALVTGASSGMGRAIALGLAAAGAKVAVVARREQRLNDLVQCIEASGGTAFAAPADVTDPTAAAETVDRTIAHFGRIDILVNAAGMSQAGSVENADLDQYRQVIDLNLMSAIYTCRAASGPMKAQGSGDIVNISSMASGMAVGGMSAYATSKRALNAMTDGLRQDLAPHGVRVCLLIPGGTKTEFAESITSEPARQAMQAYLSRDGLMDASDIAEAVVFIVSLPPRANVSQIQIHPTMDRY
jgi:NADP-dependent 3-hydroxy acid dehydrogenase YdfG